VRVAETPQGEIWVLVGEPLECANRLPVVVAVAFAPESEADVDVRPTTEEVPDLPNEGIAYD